MTKGSKVRGRLEARRKAYRDKPGTKRPGSFKKPFPKTASRGTKNRSHTS